MELYTGVDLLEIPRIAHSLRNPRFLGRFFGPRELLLYRQRGESPGFLAANFCAKEAFAKALGTGVRGFALREVETLRDELGRPFFVFSGRAEKLAEASGLRFSLSLSHTRDTAAAFVTAWRPDSRENTRGDAE